MRPQTLKDTGNFHFLKSYSVTMYSLTVTSDQPNLPAFMNTLGFSKPPLPPPCIVQHKIPPWHTIQIMCPSILHPLSNTHFLYSLFRCFDKTPRNLIEGKVYLGLTVQKG